MQLGRELQQEPQRWLRLPDSDLLLFAQAPEIKRQNVNLEIFFNVPENSARLLLQRIAKSDSASVIAAQPVEEQ